MNHQILVDFWNKQSKKDFETALLLFKSKRYAPCLFFLHLSLEKNLKSIVAGATHTAPPYTHDLVTLAKVGKISLTDDQMDFLREVNTFNIRARYDDYKYNFYKRATAPYTKKHIKHARQFILWLQNHF